MRSKRRRRLRHQRHERALRRDAWQKMLRATRVPHHIFYEQGPVLGHLDFGVTFYINSHT